MHSMPWLVQLAQLVWSEQGFLQDGRELWLGFPTQERTKQKKTDDASLSIQALIPVFRSNVAKQIQHLV